MNEHTTEGPQPTEEGVPTTETTTKRGRMERVRTALRRFPILAVILAMMVGSGISATSSSGEANAARGTATKAANELRAERDALQAEKTTLATENAALSTRVTELEASVARLKSGGLLPDVIGETFAIAEAEIESNGWTVKKVLVVSGKAEGTVVDQSPKAGTRMKPNAVVTLSVAKPAAPGWKRLYRFVGRGDKKTSIMDLPEVEAGELRIVYSFKGNTNAQLQLKEAPDEYVENYLNEIGNYSDTTYLYYSGRYFFEICCGSWTVEVQVFR